MKTRLGENQETQTPTITDPQELIDHLGSYRPFLPENSFAMFCDMTIEYLADFPVEQVDSAKSTEITVSETAEIEEGYIADNGTLTEKAIQSTTEGRIKEAMRERIEDEFKACGFSADSEELKEAFEQMEEELSGITLKLKDKQELFDTMLREFGSNTDNLSVSTTDRMTKALGRLSSAVLESDPIPEIEQKKLFGKGRAEETLDIWDKSKTKLLKKNALPSRQEVINDIIASAAASYGRSIYGDRSMVLNLGFESDDTDQIDEFQREYYDKLGGYRIALTPEEWAEEVAAALTDELLYGQDSLVSQRLYAAVGDNEYMRQTRESRRGYSRAGDFRSKKYHQGAWGGYDRSRNYDQSTDDRQSVKDRVTQEKAKEEPADFIEGLSGPLLDTQNDIARLLDAELPSLGANDRNKVMLLCNKYLQASGARIKPEQFGTPGLKKRIVKHMISQLHPDKEGGDEKLCKEITQLFDRLKRK